MSLIEYKGGALLGIIVGISTSMYLAIYAKIAWSKLVNPPSWFAWVNFFVVMVYILGPMEIIQHEADKLDPYEPNLARRALYTCFPFYATTSLTLIIKVVRERRKRANGV